MAERMKNGTWNWAWSCLVALCMFWAAGCETTSSGGKVSPDVEGGVVGTAEKGDAPRMGVDTLRVGDTLSITYSDFPGGPLLTQQQIREDGKITLHLNFEIAAAGKARGDLEREIRDLYINKKQVYKDINISIAATLRFFSVGGEVRSPGSFPHTGEMTVTKAINAAGGMTDFGDRRKVIIIRAADQSRVTLNYKKALESPKLDLPVYPADQVFVPRSIL